MRVFVAVELPEKIKNKLREVQEDFVRLANITLAKEFHLTLKFLGEISPVKAERAKERLSSIGFKEFELYLSKLGVFPNRKFIRVLWIGVKPDKKIKKLQESVDNRLIDLFGADKRFKGHITLGRVKSIKDKDAFLKNLDSVDIKDSFSVKRFCLIKSELTAEGPKYEILGKYGL